MENRLFRQICGSDNCFLDLRHSFASDALMGGVPLAIVGEMLGHRLSFRIDFFDRVTE